MVHVHAPRRGPTRVRGARRHDRAVQGGAHALTRRHLAIPGDAPYRRLIGVGGIGTGIFLALEGQGTLGRNESRAARLLDARDYCKLHIIAHHVAVLLGADPSGSPFHVAPVGTVGGDEAGRRLLDEMRAVGMDTRFVRSVEGLPTLFSVCFLYPDGDGGNVTTIDSAASHLDAADVGRAIDALGPLDAGCIVLVAPEVPLGPREHLLRMATAAGALRVAAFTSSELPEAHRLGLLDRIDLLSMNEDEASMLAGRSFDPADPQPFLDRSTAALSPEMSVIVTVGRHGAFARGGGRWQHRSAPRVGSIEGTAGAGDALLAGAIAATAVGVPLIDPAAGPEAEGPLASALDLGVLLAAYSVTSPHTIAPGADLEELLSLAGRLGLTLSGNLSRVIASVARGGGGDGR